MAYPSICLVLYFFNWCIIVFEVQFFLPPCCCCDKSHSCLTLCDPMDCSPPGSSVHGIFQARVLGVGCHFLLQGIFPTWGSKLGLTHCRQMLYHLSHQGSPTKKMQTHKYRKKLVVTSRGRGQAIQG